MKNFKDADFLVTFTGESPNSEVVHGWDAVLAHLDLQATNQSEAESYRNKDNTGIHEADNWLLLNRGHSPDGDDRFEFSEGIGECDHVTVTRIAAPQKHDEEIKQLRSALATMVAYAKETRYRWDADQNHKVGKRLAAMGGDLPGYDAAINSVHALLEGVK